MSAIQQAPPVCPIHGQPMRSTGDVREGREVFACIVLTCSVEHERPITSSDKPTRRDP